MAEHDCISEHGISKAQRRYIVGYVLNRGDTGTPNIHLNGKCLREAEFETGVHLTVKISDGCIVLVLDSEEVDLLKHGQEALRQQLREIKLANQSIKSATDAAPRGKEV